MDYLQPRPKELLLAYATLRQVELRAQRNKRAIRKQLKALLVEWAKEKGYPLQTWPERDFAIEEFAKEFMLDPTQLKRILARDL